jgi:hypothetical protein
MDAAVSAGSQAGLGAPLTCRSSRRNLTVNAPVQQDLVAIKVNFFSCLRLNKFLAHYPITHQNNTKVTKLEQLGGRGALGEQLAGTIEQSACRVPLLLLSAQRLFCCLPPWVDSQVFRRDVAAQQAIGG